MKFRFKIKDKNYHFNSSKFYDLSIALNFNNNQPNIYGIEKATSVPYKDDNFVGDTRLGGSCNFEKLKLIPHCNGTHTECIGHITKKRISINEQLKNVLIPNTLISITPERITETDDTYRPKFRENDLVITRLILVNAMKNADCNFLEALTIRTFPNSKTKLSRNYLEKEPPFFSIEAMEYIVELGIDHLLVDTPSVDRNFDEGQLNVHRIFWNINKGSNDINKGSEMNKTITEMIYVPNHISDGKYLLNLQIAPLVSDASPSRPILFEIIEE